MNNREFVAEQVRHMKVGEVKRIHIERLSMSLDLFRMHLSKVSNDLRTGFKTKYNRQNGYLQITCVYKLSSLYSGEQVMELAEKLEVFKNDCDGSVQFVGDNNELP